VAVAGILHSWHNTFVNWQAISFLLKGIIIGFSIAAPIGPIGALCVRRTLTEGRTTGLVSGLGAATADVFYGCVAGFGLTTISNYIISWQVWLRGIGGLFLCYLGIRAFLSKPGEAEASPTRGSISGAYGSTFLLTLANPMTILSFAAIFAGFGLANLVRDYVSTTALVLGVFIGSSFWWVILCTVVSLFRPKLGVSGLAWVNRISGVVIIGFGLLAILSLSHVLNF
jgi:threonine/homoserine/homoserine lactone efflux protein